MNGLKFEVVKTQFFDRAVTKHLSTQAKRVLSKFGAYVRRSSKQSIKPARRKSQSDLTERERKRFEIRLREWSEGRLKTRPKRPMEPSKPGDPPRSRFKGSPIKLIFFLYDPRSESVIVGPIAYGRRGGVATEALEYGGRSINDRGRSVHIENRPFMRPAFQSHLPDLARWKAE